MVITLRSSDGEIFEVKESVAKLSVTIKNMIEDDAAAGEIPLPNVDARTLSKVLEFCNAHPAAAEGEGEGEALPEFGVQYKQLLDDDQGLLFDLVMAANYLNISKLLDLLCKTVANDMSGKSPDDIRRRYHIKNDYSAEEEEEVRRENAWAFEEN